MAAPKSAPAGSQGTTYYSSPDVVPDRGRPTVRGWSRGCNRSGRRLGAQGPDQGFALSIAARLTPDLHVQPGERVDDAVVGCVAIALRRASMFSRAPVVHDVRIAFTIWGYFDASPPADLLARRAALVRRCRQRQPPLRRVPGDRRPGARVDAADDAATGRPRSTRPGGCRSPAPHSSPPTHTEITDDNASRHPSASRGKASTEVRARRPERADGQAGRPQGQAGARLLLSQGRHARVHGAGMRAARHRRRRSATP